MIEVTDYYFDLQNIADIDDCTENCNDNVILLFKQIIKSILKDHTEYDIAVLDNDSELFKMTGGDGVTSFPYKHIEEMLDFLFQKSKFIQEKKDELYNSLFDVHKKNEIVPIIPVTDSEPPIVPVADSEPPIVPVTDSEPLIVPVTDSESPIVPVTDSEPPIVPVTDSESPIVPVTDSEPHIVPASDNEIDIIPETDIQPPIEAPSDIQPPFGSLSDNQSQNNENVINQNGGYKKTQNKLFSNIKNIITIKISVYNNAIKKSFLKKLKINDSFLKIKK